MKRSSQQIQTPYETDVLEDAAVGTTVFTAIEVTDRDTVGETLSITCAVAEAVLGAEPEQRLPANATGCEK